MKRFPLSILCTLLLLVCTAPAAVRAEGEPAMKPALIRNLEAGRAQHVVFYGTSLTAGGAWVGELESELSRRFGDRVRVTNAAKSGETSRWGLENLQTRVIEKRPDAVFIEFAINDAVARFDLSLEESRRNLVGMITRIRRDLPECQIILQVMNPVIDRPAGHAGHRPHLDAYEAMYREVAEEHGLLLIDHAPQWRNLLGQGEDEFRKYAPDGLHPNADGYRRFVMPTILAALSLNVAADAADDGDMYDIVVYGGTSGAVTAAVQAKQMGKRVVLVSPDKHLGGLTASGLGWTDSGNRDVIGGLSREFYHRLWKHYQNPRAWRQQTRAQFGNVGQHGAALDTERQMAMVFEPHVAERAFDEWIEENNIPLYREELLDRESGVTREGGRITAIRTLSGKTFRGRVFIDATYEGDLMAAAGVGYTVGRESNATYGETINGIQTARALKNQLPKGIDPYVVPGDPSSGLLPGVNPDAGGKDGEGDHRVQAYCFRLTLTNAPDNRVPVPKPDGYDERDFELLFRAIEAGQDSRFFKFDPMPNRKTDSNNDSGMSNNLIGGNYDYPEASYERRREIVAAHRYWQQGLVWTLQNHPRVPEKIRTAHQPWGLPKDEYLDNGHWPHQIYVREARRMVGDVVVTELHLRGLEPTYRSIGMGSYKMDSHNVQRYVAYDDDGKPYVRCEGDVQIDPGGPYPIDYGAIVPKKRECENLLVPLAVSASHIAFGSIRMEPVFMILGQSAATAGALAIDDGVAVQDVDYDKLRARLEADGQVLYYGNEPSRADGRSGIVVDDAQAQLRGAWGSSTAEPGFAGAGYRHDANRAKGELSATFVAALPKPGRYEVRFSYTPHENRATNVPVTIHTATGPVRVTVDQRQRPSDRRWISLGSFEFQDEARVVVTNDGTDGFVVIDAIEVR